MECHLQSVLYTLEGYMRDKFVRELKKVKGRKSGDSGPVYSPS